MLLRKKYLTQIRGFYDSDLVKILVGIRRCGKSVILNQIRDEIEKKKDVDKEHIIFINFEGGFFYDWLTCSFFMFRWRFFSFWCGKKGKTRKQVSVYPKAQ